MDSLLITWIVIRWATSMASCHVDWKTKKVACINDFLEEPITDAEFASHSLEESAREVFVIELTAY